MTAPRQRTQVDQLVALQRVQGLLDVARLVGSDRSLDSVLSEIARTISEALGFQGVAFNLYRPAWDDFIVSTVHGSEAMCETLLGETYDWSVWSLPLEDRFERRGAYFIPEGWSTGPTPSSARATCPTSDGRGRRRLGPRRRAVRALPALRRAPARHRLGRRAGVRHAARPTTSSTCSWPWCRSPRAPCRARRRPSRPRATAPRSSSCCRSPRACPSAARSTRCSRRCATASPARWTSRRS